MTLVTFVTSEACRAQTIDVGKFFMEQKMIRIFISFQQKKNFDNQTRFVEVTMSFLNPGLPGPPHTTTLFKNVVPDRVKIML